MFVGLFLFSAAALLQSPPFVAASLPPADKALVETLRAKDTLLLNAVHRGNRAAWDAATTPDFLYVEEGRNVDKRDVFERAGKGPGFVRRDDSRLSRRPLLATQPWWCTMMMCRPRTMDYLMTETWQLLGGDWKLDLDAVRDRPAGSDAEWEMKELR